MAGATKTNAKFTEVIEVLVDDKKFSAEWKKIEKIVEDSMKRMPALSEGIGAKALAASIRDLEKVFDHFGKNAGDVLDNLSETISESTATTEKSVANIGKAVDKTLAGMQQLSQQQAKTNRQAQDHDRTALSSMSRSIGLVLKWVVLYRLVGETFQLLGQIAASPFTAIKEGFDYLNKFQDRSAELRANLMQAVEFSAKPAENFRIAGQEADRLARRIEEMSAKLGVKFEIVQAAFQGFLAAGGRNLTKSLDESLHVAGLVTAALQSIRPQIMSRQLTTEMANLVSGKTTGKTSFLAEALGMTNAQLAQMVAHAEKYHDLLSQILEKSPGLANRLDAATKRQLVLTELLARYRQRWEALVAGPTFDRFTSLLRAIANWMDDNDALLKGLGKAAGEMVGSLGQFVENFTKANWNDAKEDLKDIAKFMAIATASAIKFAESLITGVRVASLWLNRNGRGTEPMDAAVSPEGRSLLEQYKQGKINADTYRKKLDELAKKSYRSPETTAAMITQAIGNFTNSQEQLEQSLGKILNMIDRGTADTVDKEKEHKNKPRTGIMANDEAAGKELQALRDWYAEQRQIVKTEEGLVRDLIDRNEHFKTESLKQGEESRIASIQREYDAEVALATQAIAKMMGLSGMKTEDRQHFASQIRKQLEAELLSTTKAKTAALDKIADDQNRADSTRINNRKRLEIEYRRQMLQFDKEMERQGLMSHEAAARSDLELRRAELDEEIRLAESRKTGSSAEDAAKEGELALLKQRRANELQTKEQAIFRARRLDRQEEMQHILRMMQLDAERHRTLVTGATGRQAPFQVRGLEINALTAEQQAAQKRVNLAREKEADAVGRGSKAQAEAAKELADAEKNLAEVNQKLRTLKVSVGEGISQFLFGFNISEAMAAASGGVEKFAVAVEGAGNALTTIQGLINTYKQGAEQGGTLGGIGAVGSQVSGLVSAINPIAGAIVGGVSQIFSFVGGLFTAAARRIAKEIRKELSETMDKYTMDQITLAQTISEVERERASAISRLSGKKGGQKELDKLLPEIDRELASLKKQQKDILQNFEKEVYLLAVEGEKMQEWVRSWVDLNKQVKEYLEAGGSAAVAQQFLNINLINKRKELQDDLNDAEKQAIQDAIQLNDLLKSRLETQRQFAQQEFELLNAEAEERRQPAGVRIGRQVGELRRQRDEQLAQIDAEIKASQSKVDMERQVFNLATETAALRQRQNELDLLALQEMRKEWMTIQALLTSTYGLMAGSNGYFYGPAIAGGGAVPGFGASNQPIEINFNGDIHGPNGEEIANGIAEAIDFRLRTRGRAYYS